MGQEESKPAASEFARIERGTVEAYAFVTLFSGQGEDTKRTDHRVRLEAPSTELVRETVHRMGLDRFITVNVLNIDFVRESMTTFWGAWKGGHLMVCLQGGHCINFFPSELKMDEYAEVELERCKSEFGGIEFVPAGETIVLEGAD